MTIVDKPPTEPEPRVKTRRPRSQIVAGVVLISIGVLWLLERMALVDLSITAVLGIATTLTGLALMVLAREGGHGGLAVFGTILALVTLMTAAAPFEGFQGGVGDRTFEVTSTNDIRPDYNLAMGKLTIDLSQVDDLAPGTTLNASVGMGELIVRVPEGTDVIVDARVGAGELEIFDRSADGIGIDESYRSPGETGGEDLTLNLQVFAGKVEVGDE